MCACMKMADEGPSSTDIDVTYTQQYYSLKLTEHFFATSIQYVQELLLDLKDHEQQ